MKVSKVLITLVILSCFLGTASSADAVSSKLYLQGRLTNAAGAYLPDGTYPILFNLYKSKTATSPLWFDTFANITVSNGNFSVTLGSQKAITSGVLYPDKPALPERVSIFAAEGRWLEVVVDGEVFGPRVRINTSGYAANADTLDGLDSTKFIQSGKVLLDRQIPPGITRDTELAAGLGTKANEVHTHDDRYYTKAQVDALSTQIAALQTAVAQLTTTVNNQATTVTQLQATVAGQQTALAAQQALLQNVSRSGNDITFSGVNVRIVNGAGTTETKNTLGNLIVGYNEARGDGTDDRTGSHNIVAGKCNNYSYFGGMVVGLWNASSGTYASVSGGGGNTASEHYASVSGGSYNTASEDYASVSGGYHNKASGDWSFVGGGGHRVSQYGNQAVANLSAVLGGAYNIAGVPGSPGTAELATISGGDANNATGWASTVSGGSQNKSTATCSAVGGGQNLTNSTSYGFMP